MFEWSEQHKMIQGMMRRFVEAEVVPHVEALEHGDLLPYPIMRKLVQTFGLADMQRGRFERQRKRHHEEEAMRARGETPPVRPPKDPDDSDGEQAAMQAIPVIELSRYCPGLVTAMGVSVGLTAGAIMSKGTWRQKERWGIDLATLDKIGAWAITEPGSGSDAFGAMKATARPEGDDYLLNGSKTFITNGPFADTIIFICKLDRGEAAKDRKVVSFILDRGMPGLTQSKPLRKMGMHSSPTGELFLEDVRVGRDRLLGESEESSARDGAKETFGAERVGVLAMALGMIERALALSVEYARTRVQFGRPIGDFQLIQLKLAKMEVARMNVQNLLFRNFEMVAAGVKPTLAEASAGKLYAAGATMEVCLEAVQVHGGNGYMAEYHVEQLARDAKVLQIYGGTDEIQISQLARDLLARGA
ncbi:MAG: acyl-CoA dehydrogenase [Myxococcales bacterium]|nr:acyl-CoA dehydrogenase [Myxococcales bacterium]